MLPVLPKVTALKQKKISAFGGIDLREGAKENSFAKLYGADNKNGTTVETGNMFMCADTGFAVETDDIMYVDNEEGGKDVYWLGEGGFYKNGVLIPFYMGRSKENITWTSKVKKDIAANTDGTYSWNGDFRHTKLIRYDKYVFAVPQMIFTDGTETFFWDRFGVVDMKGGSISVLSKSIKFYIDEMGGLARAFRILQQGDVVELYSSGSKKGQGFIVREKPGDYLILDSYDDNGEEYEIKGIEFPETSKIYSIGVRLKNIPQFADASVVYNRMFGVSGNRVMASALAKPFKFDVGQGTEADAWWADTEDSEKFTAIASLNGRVVAFKGNATYEIYGTVNPYTIKDVSRSVGCICRASLKEVNGVLFLLTGEGMSVYGGSKFVNINEAFCNRDNYIHGVGKGTKFYALTSDGVYKYDYYTGLWTNVTDMQFVGIADIDFDIFGIVGDGRLVQLTGEKKDFLEYTDDIKREWVIESITLGAGDFYAEGINKLELRLETDGKSEILTEIARDGGEFKACGKIGTSVGWQICTVPIGFVPCSTFRYRIRGVGRVKLRLISYSYRKGGRGDKYE